MDICRLLLALSNRIYTTNQNTSSSISTINNSNSNTILKTTTTTTTAIQDKNMTILNYIQNIEVSNNNQYDISKFPQLRNSSIYQYTGLSLSNSLYNNNKRKNERKYDILRFSTQPLLKSLLKYNNNTTNSNNNINSKLYIELFNILLVIMYDKPLNTLTKMTKNSINQHKHTNITIETLIIDIINAATIRYPIIANEVYIQLIKQLTFNPSKKSYIRGWLLFSIYLHTFTPTIDALPYIKHYINTCLHNIISELYNTTNTNTTSNNNNDHNLTLSEETRVSNKYAYHIIHYCSLLISKLEIYIHNTTTTLYNTTGQPDILKPVVPSTAIQYIHNNQSILTSLNTTLIYHIYEQKPLDIEIALMTGTIVKFSIPYGQCSTVYSLLCYLYDYLLPHDAYYEKYNYNYEQHYDDTTNNNTTTTNTTNNSTNFHSPQSKKHRILNLFKGYNLYKVQESDFNANRSELDLINIPVQANYSNNIDTTHDIQLDLLFLHHNNNNNTTTNTTNIELNKNNIFNTANILLLRRKIITINESYCDEYEIFEDQVSDNNIAEMQTLWLEWLSKEQDILPSDHVRIDLNYAEDTRYVNSGLYNINNDSLYYLLSMQLSLCWIDDQMENWIGLNEEIIENSNISIRPCYKFPPEHILTQIHNNNTSSSYNIENKNIDNLTTLEEIELYSNIQAELLYNNNTTTTKNEEVEQGSVISTTTTSSSEHHSELNKNNNPKSTTIYDDNISDTSSEYISSVDSISIPEAVIKLPLTDINNITQQDHIFLQQLLTLLGITIENIDINKIFTYIIQFHNIAIKSNQAIGSPKYRYLLKRAYIQYLSSATPYYGSHFAEAILIQDPSYIHQKQPKYNKNDNKIDNNKELKKEIKQPKDVLVAISIKALVLLEPETWNIQFYCPLWDILDFSIITGKILWVLLCFVV